MIKIKFEEPKEPKRYPKTNLYLTAYGWLDCWAIYMQKPVNEITIVRQHNFLRTLYLLLHELGHWGIDKIFGEKKGWKIHEKYDDIDRKLTARYFNITPPKM